MNKASIVLLGALAGCAKPSGADIGEHLHSLSAFGPTRVFVGAHGASVLSDDGGKTLVRVAALEGRDAMEAASDPLGKRIIVAGHGGAAYSDDAGATWTNITSKLPGYDVHALGVDRSDTKHWFVFIAGHGVYVTHDDAGSWRPATNPPDEPVGAGVLEGRTLLVGAASGGLLRSSDDGRSWEKIAPQVGGTLLSIDPLQHRRLYLSGAGPLFVSEDRGASWSQRTMPRQAQIVTVASDGSLYAAGYDATHRVLLWHSRDRGAHWSAV